MENTVNQLLKSSCPSIKYRIKTEILGESTGTNELMMLQQLILEDKMVQAVFGWEQADHFLGTRFHTAESHTDCGAMEIGLRLLYEKGVSRLNERILKYLIKISGDESTFAKEFLRVGKILDNTGLGGSKLIRAVLFSYFGYEDKPYVKEAIEEALRIMEKTLEATALEDIAEGYRGKMVFKKDTLWPCIYHLRLLAYTKGWRTPENRERVAAAINHLITILPFQATGIYLKNGGQLIAPCGPLTEDFVPKLSNMGPLEWMRWFNRTELLARLGVIKYVPVLQNQINELRSMLNQDGVFDYKLTHFSFIKWSAYSGLALEENWRSHTRRINDLTFRCLLIMHYSQL